MTLPLEFQAVVLAAGKGSRMTEITTGKPKCLLPVGTKPLVWYPLYKLQQTGFTDAILIVLENQKSDIQAVLDKSDLEIRIEYFQINGNEDLGTAESLRLLHDKLKSDVIVLTCDLITDVSLNGVLNMFRMHDASVASLLFHSPPTDNNVIIPGPKSKYKPERDLIGIDAQTNRMVFLASASDFESELTLPNSLFRKHTHIKMYSNLIDSHLYILKNWVIKYLYSQPNFSTMKGEFLPHIIKKQLSKSAKGTCQVSPKSDSEEIFKFAQEDEFTLLIRETSSYNDHIGDFKSTYHGDSVRCYAYIADAKKFGIRINTLPAYWNISNQIKEKWNAIVSEELEQTLKHPKAEIKSTQVDENCIIWEGAKLNEKTSFKNSIIGPNTEVSSFTRILNCIVMSNVTIKEKVVLENSIVCDGAIIESGCKIKNCLVGTHHLVQHDSEHTAQVLTDSDRLMEF